jgi:hypothetical protein
MARVLGLQYESHPSLRVNVDVLVTKLALPCTRALPVALAKRPVPPVNVMRAENETPGPLGALVPALDARNTSPFAAVIVISIDVCVPVARSMFWIA